METKTYPLGVLLSLTTGKLLCEFSNMHEAAEFVMGRPIWSHEFGYRPTVDAIREAVLSQHPQLASVNADAVDPSNWEAFLWLQRQLHRDSFEVRRGNTERTEHPVVSAMKMVGQL